MAISATSALSGSEALTSAASKGTDSASSSSNLFGDMETFLYLLVTQLQNQDPLDPMDTSEYTNQLVQYANVEQSIQTNSYLETIIGQNITSVGAQATGYMDKVVQFDSTTVPLQDGYAKFSYTLESDAAQCTVSLLNSSNQVVKTFQGELEAGRYVLEWDGLDNNGEAVENGAYSLVVSASDGAGKELSPYTTAFGVVTGVAFDGDSVAVSVGGSVISTMDKILAVHSKSEWHSAKATGGLPETLPDIPEIPDQASAA